MCKVRHDLPKLVASPRPGHWHFEKVPERVVTPKSDFTSCHVELTPTYFPETHPVNRLTQVQACITCHTRAAR